MIYTIHTITRRFNQLLAEYGWALLDNKTTLYEWHEEAGRLRNTLASMMNKNYDRNEVQQLRAMSTQLKIAGVFGYDPYIPVLGSTRDLNFLQINERFESLVDSLGWVAAFNEPLGDWGNQLVDLQLSAQAILRSATSSLQTDLNIIIQHIGTLLQRTNAQEESCAGDSCRYR